MIVVEQCYHVTVFLCKLQVMWSSCTFSIILNTPMLLDITARIRNFLKF